MSISIEIFGWLGAFLAISMYLPQTIKVLKNKNSNGIATFTFLLVIIGASIGIIAAPLGKTWQVWVSNIVISILAIPILFYVFKARKKYFILLIIFILFTWVISIVFWVYYYKNDITQPFWSRIFIVTMAGTFTSASLIPQAIKLFKEKNIGNFSLFSTLLIIINNLLWIIYWSLKIGFEGIEDKTYNVIALSWCILPLITPILIVFLNRYHMKEILNATQ